MVFTTPLLSEKRHKIDHFAYGLLYNTLPFLISLVYIQTLMIQNVLEEPAWMNMMAKEDLRGLTPLIYSNVNPYGLIQT